jgi:GntR family transcriptional regulator/MocR family aminotransferase
MWIIVGGTQQALALALRVLADEGEPVVIEDPVTSSCRMRSILTVPCLLPPSMIGLVCSALPVIRPSMIWACPSHQFPSGAIMSQSRREELLRYAAKHLLDHRR